MATPGQIRLPSSEDYRQQQLRASENLRRWVSDMAGNFGAVAKAPFNAVGALFAPGAAEDTARRFGYVGPAFGAQPVPAPGSGPARGAVAPGILDPTMNAETAVTAPVTATAAPGPGALPPVAPFTAQDIRATSRVPVPGTGAFVNNTTGAVTNLDTRAAQAADATGAVRYQPQSPAAQFFGAGMRMRQAAKVEDRAVAQARLGADYALKVPGAAKDEAQAARDQLATRIALRIADPSTPEPERERLKTAAGSLYGRFESATASVPQSFMGDMVKGPVPVVTTRGPGMGAVNLVTPTQSLTFAQAKAQAMKNPQYKFISDAQLRRDLEATGKYKLTD